MKTPRALVPAVVLITIVAAMLFAPVSQAGEHRDPMRKLGRGLSNLLGGVTEIPHTIHEVTQEDGDFAGLTYGTIKGVGRFFTREVVGAVEVLTFPTGNGPVIEPEFPMEHDASNRWHVRRPVGSDL